MRLVYVLAPIALTVAVVAVWAALLPACAAGGTLALLAPGACPSAEALPAVRDPRDEMARTRALEARLRDLERRLAELGRCPVEPLPAAAPPDPWKARDLQALQGCWALDGAYPMTDLTDADLDPAQTWRVCFGPDGQGEQSLGFAGDVTCEGPMQGRFAADGAVLLDDGAAIPCSDENPVLRRSGSCERDVSDGTLLCRLADADGPPATVRLRPESRGD